jgi:response regulator RpfG family c-di-GMP phosphodiesterase
MKHTILAVDDEPANLRMLERLFHRDYRVLTAASGEDALEILRDEEDIALIITDQRMPGMSGTDLLRESLRRNPDAVKIILTGYSDIEALIDAINTSRVYKYVSKPWDPVALKETVSEAVARHQESLDRKRLFEGLMLLVQSHSGLFRLDPNGFSEMACEPVD